MDSFILADQKIPDSKKTIEWHKDHVRQFLAFNFKNKDNERVRQQLQCWKAYLCVTDKEGELKNRPITTPYGISLGLEWISYPLIESMLEQMIGEFMVRGVKKKTYVLNKSAQTKKLNDMFDMIAEDILRPVNKELEPALGFVPETEQPDKELPEDVEQFIESDFKTTSEEVSDTILNQVLLSKKQMDKIHSLFLDFLLYDECIATVDKKDSQPSICKENIFETSMDFNPDEEIQNDPQYVAKHKFISYNSIINSFDLSDEELAILKNYNSTSQNVHTTEIAQTGYDSPYTNWFIRENNILMIKCTEMIWKSQKKIQVKVSINKKTGKEIYKSVSDDYKKRKDDNVKSIWVEQKRKCFMVGPDLVLEWGVDNERASRIDDPKKDALFTVGIRRNNGLNSLQVRSAAAKLLQLQEFASECLFELRLAMRRNNGRVLVYDAAQVPKQFIKTGGYQNAINRVMHHAKKDQFLIINSADKQSRYAFNQFTSLDMSTKGLMQDIFNTLALIEQLASKFIGISPQQTGQVTQYETAVGTERAVAQTTTRQEVYVKPFETFLKFLFDKILIKGKHCYEENETAQYIFGDLKTKFFTVYPEYFQEDVGVYIGDNYLEQKRKQNIDRAAEQALASAQTPELILNLIQTLNSDTASESEKVFKKGIKAVEKLRQENMAAEKENAKMIADATDRATAAEDKRAADKNQNNLDVANIYAENNSITNTRKNASQEAIKLADIEKEMILADKKSK